MMFHFRWVAELRRQKAVTTCKHYLLDIKKYISYVQEEASTNVRVSGKTLSALKKTLIRELVDLHKEVAVHRQEVRASKSSKYIAP